MILAEPRVMDEEAAILACQRGDAAAFRMLFELHVARVFGIAYLIVRDHERAEDIAQDTFLILLQRLPGLAPGPLHSWLGRVAANLSLNDRRRAVQLPFESLSTAERERLETQDAVPSCDVVLEAAEDQATLRQAVAALPPRQRAMVVLRYFGDCSLAEISTALGCRPGTVRATLHQAIKRLRPAVASRAGDCDLRPCARGQVVSSPIPQRGEPEYEA